MIKCDFSPSWVDTFTKESSRLPWGGWLQQNQDWWEAHQAHPNQILWITFEECKKDPRGTVRRIAEFLELSVTDQVSWRARGGGGLSWISVSPKELIVLPFGMLMPQ